MRSLALVVASAALVVTGCVHAPPPLRPALAEQAVEGDPRAASAEVAGVRLTIRAGDLGGWLEDVEDAVTPVAVSIENESGKAIRVRPRLFTVVGANGFRYEPLRRGEVRRLLRARGPYGYGYGYPGLYGGFGLYGAYPWIGWPGAYPFLGWGMAWAPPPPRPPPAARAGSRQPSGTLEDGGEVDLLLFYPVPARQLGSALVQAAIVAVDGTQLGTVQVPLVRGGNPPPRAQPPPPAPPEPAAPEPPPAESEPPPAASEPPPAPAQPPPAK
jgi:hypothetical protein